MGGDGDEGSDDADATDAEGTDDEEAVEDEASDAEEDVEDEGSDAEEDVEDDASDAEGDADEEGSDAEGDVEEEGTEDNDADSEGETGGFFDDPIGGVTNAIPDVFGSDDQDDAADSTEEEEVTTETEETEETEETTLFKKMVNLEKKAAASIRAEEQAYFPNMMKKLDSADQSLESNTKTFLQKSMPYIMKSLKYQGIVLTKDPNDDLTKSVDSTMSYYMPNLAESIHNLENKGASTIKSFAQRMGNSMPLYLTKSYQMLVKGDMSLGKDVIKAKNFIKSKLQGDDDVVQETADQVQEDTDAFLHDPAAEAEKKAGGVKNAVTGALGFGGDDESFDEDEFEMCMGLMEDDDLNDFCDENCSGCLDDDEDTTCNTDECVDSDCKKLMECMVEYQPCFAECGTEDDPLYCATKCGGCADGVEDECDESCEAMCSDCAVCLEDNGLLGEDGE